MNRYIPFVGRLLIGLPFALSGLSKLTAIDATLGYIQSVGLPMPTVALVLAPSPVRAQGLGVVTTLTGTATLARASQSQPLRFRDSLFEQDKIATAEKSLVRVLLGGKAVVTIREFSELTITEGRNQQIRRMGVVADGT